MFFQMALVRGAELFESIDEGDLGIDFVLQLPLLAPRNLANKIGGLKFNISY